MKDYSKALVFAAFLATGGAAIAQQWYQGDAIHSGLLDTSGLHNSAANFGGTVVKEDSDPDFFVNQYQIVGGGNWNDSINVGPGTKFNGNPLGTLVTGSFQSYFEGAQLFGAVDPSVAIGVYDFKLNVLGGSTDSSFDTLASWDYQLDVRSAWDVTVTGSLSKDLVGIGEQVDLSMTVKNNNPVALMTTTWYLSGGDDAAGSFMDWDFEYDPGWWDVTIDPGVAETRLHSHYVPVATTPPGFYHTPGGVIGGYYRGDWHMKSFENEPGFTVVPEPATTGLLLVGLAGLLGRRRRAATK